MSQRFVNWIRRSFLLVSTLTILISGCRGINKNKTPSIPQVTNEPVAANVIETTIPYIPSPSPTFPQPTLTPFPIVEVLSTSTNGPYIGNAKIYVYSPNEEKKYGLISVFAGDETTICNDFPEYPKKPMDEPIGIIPGIYLLAERTPSGLMFYLKDEEGTIYDLFTLAKNTNTALINLDNTNLYEKPFNNIACLED
jgi:hypothetical protein